MIWKFCFVIVLFLKTSMGFSHGEDKPGPHGGKISMPGAYHVEIVKSDKGLKVYLLDMNWKKPVTEKSTVSIIQETKIKEFRRMSSAACQPDNKEKFFLCAPPDGLGGSSEPGAKVSIKIVSNRMGQAGIPVAYDLNEKQMPKSSKKSKKK